MGVLTSRGEDDTMVVMKARLADRPEVALLDFVDLESTCLVQALTMAADANEVDAETAMNAGDLVNAQVMRSSAASWRAKAQRLRLLCDALPSRS